MATRDDLLRLARLLAPIVFFALALWLLRDSLREYGGGHLVAALRELGVPRLALALAISASGYLVLAGYDLLGFRFIGRAPRLRDLALASFVSNALGNSFGNILVTGAAVRYWIYTALGISPGDVGRVVIFCSLGFWLGFIAIGGVLFVLFPVVLPAGLPIGMTTTRPAGFVLLALLGGYFALVATRRTLSWGTRRLALPSPGLTLAQIAVASLDVGLMGAALYVLLPPAAQSSYGHFLAVFLLALLLANASQVPGGLGVFEATVLLLAPAGAAAPDVAAGLLAFRAAYFVLPLAAATAWIGWRESRRRLPALRGLVRHSGTWIGTIVPRLLAGAIFASGAVLLFSGALPAAAGRLAALHELVPLSIIETSHFAASLAGAALLLLAQAVQRRVDVAYVAALFLLGAGGVLSLAKGWDYEEAIVLGAVFASLLPFRHHFYREASFLGERFTAGWIVSIAVVLLGSTWLAVFAYTHPDYSAEPWWGFAVHAEAARSARATVAAMSLAVLFGVARLLRPARPALALPSAAELERAAPIVERSPRTYPNLAFRRDKALLFSASGNALLMYGRMGRSWIAMGDPVGPADEARELLSQFRDACDRSGGWSVFFEVQPDHLDWYAGLGLTLTTLGEEARVDLTRFDLNGPEHARLRQGHAKLGRAGCLFEIVPREAVPGILPALAAVSEAWLSGKATREKGFSNASFDERYLAHFPIAVVRRNDAIIAFANLWLGAGREELSVDLMRHTPQAPNGTMDFLFTGLLGWGRGEGFRWFNLGTAPLSGLGAHRGPPLWRHLGTFVFQHGEHFYNFRGLRAYKEKFHPVWTPVYLASPGGAALPAVLVDVTALIAGGFMGVFSKQRAAKPSS